MRLIAKWEIFSQQIDDFVNEAKIILDREYSIKTESEFVAVKSEINDWVEKCHNYLKVSFDIENNNFAQSFIYAKKERYIIENPKEDLRQSIKEAFEDLKSKQQMLIYSKRILGISDAIIKPDIVDIGKRNTLTTEETLDVILEKLYDLYDNYYHSIPTILEGNNIPLKRAHEDRELGKLLEDYGYVKITNMRDTQAQLTLQGKMYIEEKRKIYKENYEEISKSQDEINNRVDEIIEKLTKLGYGQEIIFDEIQELKELYTSLNKKNWGQIVKGKLIDLALAKLIENDTAKYIYETLTDHKLRLP